MSESGHFSTDPAGFADRLMSASRRKRQELLRSSETTREAICVI